MTPLRDEVITVLDIEINKLNARLRNLIAAKTAVTSDEVELIVAFNHFDRDEEDKYTIVGTTLRGVIRLAVQKFSTEHKVPLSSISEHDLYVHIPGDEFVELDYDDVEEQAHNAIMELRDEEADPRKGA
jgi:predicted homoserine dehydrogenase-like protein